MTIGAKRPKGLVPGSVDWLREVEGPRLVSRLVDEVHANPVGEMTPTQARCAAMLMDRVLPQVSAVHHTVETVYARMTEDELRKEFLRLTAQHATDAIQHIPALTPIEADHDYRAADRTQDHAQVHDSNLG